MERRGGLADNQRVGLRYKVVIEADFYRNLVSLDHRGPRLYLGRVAGCGCDGVDGIGAIVAFIGDNKVAQVKQVP